VQKIVKAGKVGGNRVKVMRNIRGLASLTTLTTALVIAVGPAAAQTSIEEWAIGAVDHFVQNCGGALANPEYYVKTASQVPGVAFSSSPDGAILMVVTNQHIPITGLEPAFSAAIAIAAIGSMRVSGCHLSAFHPAQDVVAVEAAFLAAIARFPAARRVGGRMPPVAITLSHGAWSNDVSILPFASYLVTGWSAEDSELPMLAEIGEFGMDIWTDQTIGARR